LAKEEKEKKHSEGRKEKASRKAEKEAKAKEGHGRDHEKAKHDKAGHEEKAKHGAKTQKGKEGHEEKGRAHGEEEEGKGHMKREETVEKPEEAKGHRKRPAEEEEKEGHEKKDFEAGEGRGRREMEFEEEEGQRPRHREAEEHSAGHYARPGKTRPVKEKPRKSKALKPDFVDLKPKEIVEAIIHLANEGHSPSEIGMILRDQYGVPKVEKTLGKKLSKVLAEQNLLPKMPEDLMSLVRKSVALRAHLERNKKDMSAKRGLMLTVSKIRALEKYYKKQGKIPVQWRYSPETASLLAK